MHYAKLFDNEFVGAWDLTDDNDEPTDKTVTIERVEKKVIKGPRGETGKPVLYFKGTKKGMVCNVTNARTIAGLYSNDVASWVGKRITLYQTMTSGPAGEVMGIRVRPRTPAKAEKVNGKEQTPPPADELPEPGAGG